MEARKYEGGDIYINPRDKIINPNAIGKLLLVLLVKTSLFEIIFIKLMFH